MTGTTLSIVFLLLFFLPPIYPIDENETSIAVAAFAPQIKQDSVRQNIPTFDQKHCSQETSVTCMLPTESRKKVFMYGKGKTHKLSGVQVIMRHYHAWKMLVEIWVEGASAELKNHEGKTIFGCRSTSSGVEKITELDGAELKLLASGIDPTGKLYCRLMITSPAQEIIKRPTDFDQHQEKLTLVTDTATYNETTTDNMIREYCHVDWINNDASLRRNGYKTEEIPYENLFYDPITCPEGSVMVANLGKVDEYVEVAKIECILDAGFYYFITDLHGVTTKKNGQFTAACQYKIESKENSWYWKYILAGIVAGTAIFLFVFCLFMSCSCCENEKKDAADASVSQSMLRSKDTDQSTV